MLRPRILFFLTICKLNFSLQKQINNNSEMYTVQCVALDVGPNRFSPGVAWPEAEDILGWPTLLHVLPKSALDQV
jgi:hypothetical protein